MGRDSMNGRGYTLAELMVVVFLIGILSLLALPSWLSFWQRQQIRTATSQLGLALRVAKSEASQRLVRQAVTVCSSSASEPLSWIRYSVHSYAKGPIRFTKIEGVSLVESTVRRSPARYHLHADTDGDCYTTYLGLFPGDGYGLGYFYLSNPRRQWVYRVGFNTLLGNIASCPVVSLERRVCR